MLIARCIKTLISTILCVSSVKALLLPLARDVPGNSVCLFERDGKCFIEVLHLTNNNVVISGNTTLYIMLYSVKEVPVPHLM